MNVKVVTIKRLTNMILKKHINTIKHINIQKSIKTGDLAIILDEKSQEKIFTCEICNKEYKDNSGLWKHKKKCKILHPPLEKVEPNLIVRLN
jgi:hypothetical protein